MTAARFTTNREAYRNERRPNGPRHDDDPSARLQMHAVRPRVGSSPAAGTPGVPDVQVPILEPAPSTSGPASRWIDAGCAVASPCNKYPRRDSNSESPGLNRGLASQPRGCRGLGGYRPPVLDLEGFLPIVWRRRQAHSVDHGPVGVSFSLLDGAVLDRSFRCGPDGVRRVLRVGKPAAFAEEFDEAGNAEPSSLLVCEGAPHSFGPPWPRLLSAVEIVREYVFGGGEDLDDGFDQLPDAPSSALCHEYGFACVFELFHQGREDDCGVLVGVQGSKIYVHTHTSIHVRRYGSVMQADAGPAWLTHPSWSAVDGCSLLVYTVRSRRWRWAHERSSLPGRFDETQPDGLLLALASALVVSVAAAIRGEIAKTAD